MSPGCEWLQSGERRVAVAATALAGNATGSTGVLERRGCALTQGPSPAAGSGTNGHSSGRLQGPQRSAELSVQRRPSTPRPDTPPVQVRLRRSSCMLDAHACLRVRRGASMALRVLPRPWSLRASSLRHRTSAAGGQRPLGAAVQRCHGGSGCVGSAVKRAFAPNSAGSCVRDEPRGWRACEPCRHAAAPGQRSGAHADGGHAREPVPGAQARRLSRGDGTAAPPKPPRDALDRV